MSLIINTSNLAAIDDYLAKQQAGFRTRTLASFQLVDATEEAEKALAAIDEAQRIGTKLAYRPHVVPTGYRGDATGTNAYLVRTADGWQLDKVVREQTPRRSHGVLGRDWQLTLTASTVEEAAEIRMAMPLDHHSLTVESPDNKATSALVAKLRRRARAAAAKAAA